MKLIAVTVLALVLAAPLGGCVTKAAARAVEAPGRGAGGLLGG